MPDLGVDGTINPLLTAQVNGVRNDALVKGTLAVILENDGIVMVEGMSDVGQNLFTVRCRDALCLIAVNPDNLLVVSYNTRFFLWFGDCRRESGLRCRYHLL